MPPAPLSPSRRPFFGGLKDEDVPPGQPVPQRAQQAGRAQGQAQVKIVAAGVHHPVHPGAPGKRDLLGDGQGVHVGPPGHCPSRPGPLEHPHHPVAGDAGLHLQARLPQVVRHPRAVRSSWWESSGCW